MRLEWAITVVHRLHDGTGVEREAGKADNQHRYCSEMIDTPEVYDKAKAETEERILQENRQELYIKA